MKYRLFFLLLFTYSCTNQPTMPDKKEYPRWVGDISHDDKIDNPNFELCHGEESVLQYFNFGQGFQYDGEKIAIIEEFKKKYKPISLKNATGLIRIRFIVNCKGETDRFRMIASDDNYQEKTFDKRITNQLLNITKHLSGWKVLSMEGTSRDYYQYLIFKIKEGEIIEILP